MQNMVAKEALYRIIYLKFSQRVKLNIHIHKINMSSEECVNQMVGVLSQCIAYQIVTVYILNIALFINYALIKLKKLNLKKHKLTFLHLYIMADVFSHGVVSDSLDPVTIAHQASVHEISHARIMSGLPFTGQLPDAGSNPHLLLGRWTIYH